MTAKELAKQSKVPLWKIYYIADKLGRPPSIDEIVNWQPKRGRPPKNWEIVKEHKKVFDDKFAESNALLEKLTIRKEN